MTEQIREWLTNFQENWEKKNISKILNLFADDVTYYETPTQELENKEEIREEWQNIKDQKDIKLDLELYSRDGDKHTVKWHLEYTEDTERKLLNSIYLIELNEENRCTEFWQYCQIE